MHKSFFTFALASVLAIGAVTASAENFTPQSKVSFNEGIISTNGSEALKILMMNPSDETNMGLSDFLNAMAYSGDREFGYMRNDGTEGSKFVSLANVLASIKADDVATVALEKFEKNATIKFGYADKDGKNFTPAGVKKVKVESDAEFHGGFDPDSFFRLDFAEEPFDGNIEVLVIGEPLPASTVTLLVALAAGAGLLLFSNRKQRALRTEQA
jgi:hypothetical protein